MATARQKEVIDKLVENGGKISVSGAMREVGYSPKTAKNPKKLTESKAFKELVEDQLPDGHLLEKHRQMLDSPKITRYYKKGELETEIEEIDATAVKALDMAYKLKGSYAPEKHENKNLNVDLTKRDLISKVAQEVIKKLQENEN